MHIRFAEQSEPPPAGAPFWVILGTVIAFGAAVGTACALIGMIMQH